MSKKRVLSFHVFLFMLLLLAPMTASAEIYSDHIAVGNWIGSSTPRVDGLPIPFEAVHWQLTLFADGTAFWNDGHEVKLNHGTAHGSWQPVAGGGFHATVLLVGYGEGAPGNRGATLKVRINGNIAPDTPNALTGSLSLTVFPAMPGSDPLDPTDATGFPAFGVFDIENGRRLGEDPPVDGDVDADMTDEFILGAWFGKAVVDDPATSPFQEVVMMLNFFADRNIVATDALELLNPHTTAHGGPWDRVGNQGICPFLWSNLHPFLDDAGTFKVRITADIEADNVDEFATGIVAPVAFPPGVDALDPQDAGGQAIGPFTIVHMERIKLDPGLPTEVGIDRTGDPLIGSWYGHAMADDPDNAPFDQMYVLPTFGSRGNMFWNDSQETNYEHGTAFGEWAAEDDGSYRWLMTWLNMSLEAPIIFDGAVRGIGTLTPDPADPTRYQGSLELYKFGRDVIDLPDDLTGAEFLGSYTLSDLRRIEDAPMAGPGLPCEANDRTLCLDGPNPGDGRFEIKLHVDTSIGEGFTGYGEAKSLADMGMDFSGLFTIFSARNPEALVKVLDGCDVNGKFWVFFAAATNAGYTLTVTDTDTGASKSYTNADGNLAAAMADLEAFGGCPVPPPPGP